MPTQSKICARAAVALAATAFVIASTSSPPARAADATLFASYLGTWTGAGQISLTGGSVESLRCKGYYTGKDGGRSLGLALRCASPSNTLELRASLTTAGDGDTISGQWEERTFNAAGSVSGNARPGKIDLAITGSGFSGVMLVAMEDRSQKVSIETTGIGIKSINISFVKAEERQ